MTPRRGHGGDQRGQSVRYVRAVFLYHVTEREAGKAIELWGFKDNTRYYGTPQLWTGVWLSDRPLLDDVRHPAVFRIDFPDDLVEQYEWLEEDKGYRELLVPADIVNRCPVIRLIDWSDA
jgi:hypothetical protein